MNVQLKRLIRYVSSMSKLQSLEDIPISKKQTNSSELIKMLKNSAEIICMNKRLSFESDVKTSSFNIDIEILLQVFENLLVNAERYAKSKVSVVCSEKEKQLYISVLDDGRGFKSKELSIATEPFY